MKKPAVLIILLMITLSALMAQSNEVADNTPLKSQEQIMNDFNSRSNVNIKLYPNPVVTSMVVEPQLQSDAGTIKIMDITGKVITERRVEPGSNSLVFDTTDYISGLYILALYNDSGKLLHVSRFSKN